jgi:hypothetical protein
VKSIAGRVTSTRTVWCAKCSEWLMAPENNSKTRAESFWMGYGWIRLGHRGGWHCLTCGREEMHKMMIENGYMEPDHAR